MDIKEASLRLAAISLIADEAKKAKDRLRAELQAQMDAIGADRVKAEYGGEPVAYITTTKPKFKWEITNDRGFLAWVKANFPTEIVESVRESSIDGLLGRLVYVDDLVIDHNGEPVDWVIGQESEPYLMTKFQGDGRETLREALVRNIIEPVKVLELE